MIINQTDKALLPFSSPLSDYLDRAGLIDLYSFLYLSRDSILSSSVSYSSRHIRIISISSNLFLTWAGFGAILRNHLTP